MKLELQGVEGRWVAISSASLLPDGTYTAEVAFADVSEAIGQPVDRNSRTAPGVWRLGGRPCELKWARYDHLSFTAIIRRHKPPPAPLPDGFVLK